MACMQNCYEGRNYQKRSVKTEGSLDHVSKVAKGLANALKEDMVVYKRNLSGYGEFYDFEPVSQGREKFDRIVRFDQEPASEDILRDTGNGKSKFAKSKKSEDKSTEVAVDLGSDKGGLLQDEQPETV